MKLTNIIATTYSAILLFQHSGMAFSTFQLHARSKTIPSKSTTSSLQMSRGGRPTTKKVSRNWIYVDNKGEETIGKGKITVKVFLPEDESKAVKGCAFFMHGFSQYTKAYSDTLQKVSNGASIAVISADTGITSIIGDVITNPLGPNPQFVLQRKLSEDTKQCIQMIIDGSDEFKEFGIGKNVPIGVCGHSMGGGLSFPVAAAFPKINYVFAMAPVPGEPEFDSISDGLDIRTVNNSMLLAGSWDLIGRANKIKAISTASNEKKKNSSIFVNIARGLHTGFEDDLVITNIGLGTILRVVFGLFSAFDNIVLILLSILRKSTGQLEGSELLMELFFEKMTKNQKVLVNDAQEYLEDNMSEKDVKKFNITLG